MRLAAVLACRNQSSRLYGKPLQNLDVKNNVTILHYMVEQLKLRREIDDIVLAISENEENTIYKDLARTYDVSYITGDDNDVLSRLIKGARLVKAKHVFRVTTESPYTYFEDIDFVYRYHCDNKMDYSSTSSLPDGAYYEIISVDALERSWNEGESRHRSELCSLYIFDHKDKFSICIHEVDEYLRRNDIRLTVDWPEDLIVMRKIYEALHLSPGNPHSLKAIIEYLDKHPKINSINNWIDSGIGRVWY